MIVPQIDLVKQHKDLRTEIFRVFEDILSSGRFILGRYVEEFERKAAEYLNVRYGVGVNSGTDALVIGLRSVGIGRGDKVITTTFSFFATVESIMLVGAEPVLVDIDERTFNISVEDVKSKMSEGIKAIIAVHLFGQMAEVEKLKFEGVHLIEDAAQAFGAMRNGIKAGSFGDVGAFSFYPTKNLSALGDGGLITTNIPEVYKNAKSLRVHGSYNEKYKHENIGYNSRLDEIQAAFLLVKLRYIDEWNRKRNEIAKIYDEELKDFVMIPYVLEGNFHIYHQYTIRTDARDKLAEHLRKNGIGVSIYYPIPLHLQKPLRELGYKEGEFPVAEKISKEVLSIPIYPEMEEWQVEFVISKIKEFFKG